MPSMLVMQALKDAPAKDDGLGRAYEVLTDRLFDAVESRDKEGFIKAFRALRDMPGEEPDADEDDVSM